MVGNEVAQQPIQSRQSIRPYNPYGRVRPYNPHDHTTHLAKSYHTIQTTIRPIRPSPTIQPTRPYDPYGQVGPYNPHDQVPRRVLCHHSSATATLESPTVPCHRSCEIRLKKSLFSDRSTPKLRSEVFDPQGIECPPTECPPIECTPMHP